MSITAQEILDEIITLIQKEGGIYKTWYAGITSDIEEKLHGDHHVPKEDHWFIACKTSSNREARAIEEALLELGIDGGTNGGDTTSDFVYCYKKTYATHP